MEVAPYTYEHWEVGAALELLIRMEGRQPTFTSSAALRWCFTLQIEARSGAESAAAACAERPCAGTPAALPAPAWKGDGQVVQRHFSTTNPGV